MAYTTAQLVAAYTNANLGKAPDNATALTLDAYATQTLPGGGKTDSQALADTLKLVNPTTAVAVEAYQFFTGRAPSTAGLTYLVNSAANTNDLNDPFYAKFAQENRFINFSINLATGAGEGAAAFALAYGNTSTSTVTYAQVVASAYEKIIGTAAATAAGVNVTDAVAFLSRQANIDYLTAFVKANGITGDANIDLAVKAALIGEILNAATVSGIGIYANATTALLIDLSDGTLSTENSAGINILTSYPGTGTGVVGKAFALTTGIDALVGTSNDDTFSGSAQSGATNTANALDTIDGGAGYDTLNLSNSGAADDLAVSKLSVKSIEVVNLSSVTGLEAGKLDTTTWTGLGTANVSLAAPAVDQAVTVGGNTAVAVNVVNTSTKGIAVDGGTTVSVTTAGASSNGATINVGGTTAPTGAVTVKETGVYAVADVTLGAITVKGGSTVSITESTGITAAQNTTAQTLVGNKTVTQGAITVTGTASTTSVSVSQDAAATLKAGSVAKDGVIGVVTGAVTITDVNAASATKAGTITSVTLANGAQSVSANALTSLNLSGTNAVTLGFNAANATTVKTLAINAAGTSSVTDTNGVLTSATVSSTAAKASVTLAGAGIATVNLGGAKDLTFVAGALGALKTVNVTGAGGVTADVSGVASVTKVDTTASTGVNAITINGTTAKIAFVGGAGADTVTVNGALDANASIQLGAGNDRLLGSAAATVATTVVIDGGDGIDAVASSLINNGNAAQFKNFEVLNLSSSASFDVSLLSGSTITTLELNGGAGGATYGNVSLAQSLSVTGNSAGAVTLDFGAAAAGTSDAYTIGFNAVTTGTSTSKAAISAGTVVLNGIEAVTINSGAAAGVAANSIILNDTVAKTLTITGSQDLSVTTGGLGTAGANGFTLLDASAATGGVTVNTAGIGSATGGFTIKTGAGVDSIKVAGGQITTITTGAGKDTVDVSLSVDKIGSGATTAAFTTITDAVIGSGDKIAFLDHGAEVFNSTKVDVSTATDLGNALLKATSVAGHDDGTTNAEITWFQYGGNTYIVENVDGAGFGTSDIVVKLTGLVDLSTATNSGSHVLTL